MEAVVSIRGFVSVCTCTVDPAEFHLLKQILSAGCFN